MISNRRRPFPRACAWAAGLIGLVTTCWTMGSWMGSSPVALLSPKVARADEGGRVSLAISATGFRDGKGQAVVALYDDSSKWLKIDKAFRVQKVKIEGGRVQATFTDLPVGTYALSVIHDENQNGKLDMHWFPIPGPDEGAGVSNDATATIGPPKWNDARFQVGDKGGVMSAKIRY